MHGLLSKNKHKRGIIKFWQINLPMWYPDIFQLNILLSDAYM